ncbi:hypothetical protein J2X14_000397 [Pantoea alhagi]|nr:hypothetical protein [Pantoea alhagi]
MSLSTGLTGRRTSSPLQFGQRPASRVVAQLWQKVHSKEQIIASVDSGGRSQSQHSQLGLNSSIAASTGRTLNMIRDWHRAGAKGTSSYFPVKNKAA